MATRRWRGNAPAVAQVVTVTIRQTSNGNQVTLTHGGKSVSATSAGTNTTTLMAALATAWNAEIVPQFAEITAEASANTVVLTADNPGVPFDLTIAQSGTGGDEEVKTVTVNNSPTGGTWSWVDAIYGTVSGLAYNISAANLQTALETPYGAGNVTVTGSNGGPFTVTFGGDLEHVDIPDVTFVNTSLTGGNATVSVTTTTPGSAGTDEVQVITFYGSPSGGTFTVTFNGFTTAALAFNISSADLQTALRGLSSIGSGNINVSGSAGGPYTCTFAGTLASTAVGMLTVDASSLTGGTIYGTIATTTPGVAGTNEVQYISQSNSGGSNETMTIERTGTVSGGTFTLTYDGETSAALAYNVKLWQVCEALDAIHATKEGTGYWGPYFAPWNESYANLTIHECLAISPTGAKIQFIGSRGAADVDTADYSLSSASLTGGGSYSFPGANSQAGSVGGGSLVTSGSFTLSFGGYTTSSLTLTVSGFTVTSPTAAAVQTALEGLASIGSGNVAVTALQTSTSGPDGTSRGLFKVTFQGALAGTPVGLITGTGTVPAGQEANQFDIHVATLKNGVAGTNEVQTVTLSGSPSAGTFTLSYGTQTTGPIAYNATAADVDTALEALSNIPAGGVTCTGGALPGSLVTVTFTGALGYTDVSQLVINDTGLKVIVTETTPGVTATNEVQSISLTGSPHGGTATLTYDGQTTSSLAYNASAATVQTALEALSNLAPGDVVCTGGPWPAAIVLTFGGTLAATNVVALTGTSSLNNGTVTETSLSPITQTVTTANSGPNDLTVAANWSGETVPVNGDVVVFDQGTSDVKYHLDQSAVTLTAFYHYSSYSGNIGLPEVNRDYSIEYYEFRGQYLKFNSPIVQVGLGDGPSSGRIKLDLGTVATVVDVYRTATPIEVGIESLLLKLINASNAVNVNRGSVGIAIYPGETSTVPTLRVGFVENVAGDAEVRCGAGVTLTTIEQSGGKLQTSSALTTVTLSDGELIHNAGAVTTLRIDAGAVRYRSNSTLTTVHVGSGGNLDMSQDMRPVTITNVSLYEGFEYHDPHNRVTPTNGFDFVRCKPSDGVFDVSPHLTFTPSSI